VALIDPYIDGLKCITQKRLHLYETVPEDLPYSVDHSLAAIRIQGQDLLEMNYLDFYHHDDIAKEITKFNAIHRYHNSLKLKFKLK